MKKYFGFQHGRSLPGSVRQTAVGLLVGLLAISSGLSASEPRFIWNPGVPISAVTLHTILGGAQGSHEIQPGFVDNKRLLSSKDDLQSFPLREEKGKRMVPPPQLEPSSPYPVYPQITVPHPVLRSNPEDSGFGYENNDDGVRALMLNDGVLNQPLQDAADYHRQHAVYPKDPEPKWVSKPAYGYDAQFRSHYLNSKCVYYREREPLYGSYYGPKYWIYGQHHHVYPLPYLERGYPEFKEGCAPEFVTSTGEYPNQIPAPDLMLELMAEAYARNFDRERLAELDIDIRRALMDSDRSPAEVVSMLSWDPVTAAYGAQLVLQRVMHAADCGSECDGSGVHGMGSPIRLPGLPADDSAELELLDFLWKRYRLQMRELYHGLQSTHINLYNNLKYLDADYSAVDVRLTDFYFDPGESPEDFWIHYSYPRTWEQQTRPFQYLLNKFTPMATHSPTRMPKNYLGNQVFSALATLQQLQAQGDDLLREDALALSRQAIGNQEKFGDQQHKGALEVLAEAYNVAPIDHKALSASYQSVAQGFKALGHDITDLSQADDELRAWIRSLVELARFWHMHDGKRALTGMSSTDPDFLPRLVSAFEASYEYQSHYGISRELFPTNPQRIQPVPTPGLTHPGTQRSITEQAPTVFQRIWIEYHPDLSLKYMEVLKALLEGQHRIRKAHRDRVMLLFMALNIADEEKQKALFGTYPVGHSPYYTSISSRYHEEPAVESLSTLEPVDTREVTYGTGSSYPGLFREKRDNTKPRNRGEAKDKIERHARVIIRTENNVRKYFLEDPERILTEASRPSQWLVLQYDVNHRNRHRLSDAVEDARNRFNLFTHLHDRYKPTGTTNPDFPQISGESASAYWRRVEAAINEESAGGRRVFRQLRLFIRDIVKSMNKQVIYRKLVNVSKSPLLKPKVKLVKTAESLSDTYKGMSDGIRGMLELKHPYPRIYTLSELHGAFLLNRDKFQWWGEHKLADRVSLITKITDTLKTDLDGFSFLSEVLYFPGSNALDALIARASAIGLDLSRTDLRRLALVLEDLVPKEPLSILQLNERNNMNNDRYRMNAVFRLLDDQVSLLEDRSENQISFYRDSNCNVAKKDIGGCDIAEEDYDLDEFRQRAQTEGDLDGQLENVSVLETDPWAVEAVSGGLGLLMNGVMLYNAVESLKEHPTQFNQASVGIFASQTALTGIQSTLSLVEHGYAAAGLRLTSSTITGLRVTSAATSAVIGALSIAWGAMALEAHAQGLDRAIAIETITQGAVGIFGTAIGVLSFFEIATAMTSFLGPAAAAVDIGLMVAIIAQSFISTAIHHEHVDEDLSNKVEKVYEAVKAATRDDEDAFIAFQQRLQSDAQWSPEQREAPSLADQLTQPNLIHLLFMAK